MSAVLEVLWKDEQELAPAHEIPHIDSEDMAEWYLRKLANIDAECERVTLNAQRIVAHAQKERQRLEDMFGAELEAYAKEKLAGSRERTLHFLNGEVALRKIPDKDRVKVTDPALALAYCEGAMPEFVELPEPKPKLKQAEYKAFALRKLREDGEVLPGIVPVHEEETVRVTPGAKALPEATEE